MLPSTGYFKGLNCPFYDSGLCERPYCHFRHVKKESLGTVNDSIENGAILQKLVSKVVQKVLQQSESSDASNVASITDAPKEQLQNSNVSTISKATYNPTPIFKLNKINNSDTENDELSEQRRKHIPVPYTPRKPTSIPIKRPVDSDDYKPFIYNPPPVKYTPGVVESPKLDPYTPKGAVESKEKYLPGTEVQIQEYAPKETQTASQRQYIPSDKSVCKKKLLEYKPANITQQNKQSVTYQPTPCSLVPCFSSDEEEPVRKKPRLSSDLNGLDELGPEFDILDQIFDEEKLEQEIVKRKFKTSNDSNSKTSRSTKQSTEDKKKSSIDRDKSSNKQKSDSKVKSSEGKHDKSRSSHDKSEHKSSSKEKDNEKDKKREKEKSTKEKSRDKDRDKDKKQENHKDQNKHKGKDKDKEKDKSSDKKQSSSKSSSHKNSKNDKNDNSSKHSSHSEKSSKHKEKTDHKHKKTKDRERNSRKSKDKDSNGLSTSDKESDNVDQSDQNIELNDEDIYEISESDEESIALECKRIFEEYVPTEKPAATEVASKLEENNENEYLLGKKRVSRAIDKNIKTTPKLPVKPDYKVSAAQAMAERLAKVREFHASKKSIELKKSAELQKTEDVHIEPPKPATTPIVPSKIRIAHVPYASTLLNAKRTISTNPRAASIKSDLGTSSTITQTVKKGEKRLAHVPNDKFIDRPGVLEPLASKIPANIRTTYLNMMIDECLKIYILVTDAYNRAQHEELNTSKKCSTVQIYKNSAVLTVSRLRKELQECKGVKKSAADCNMLQRIPQGVSGSSGNAGSWSIVAKNRKNYENIQEYRGAKLYNNIQKWVLTEEQLRENGFPRPHISGEKGRAMIENQRKQKPPVGNLRTCCRCRKEYTVNKKCFPTVKEECIYHPNNKYRVRGEAKYQCCSQDATSDGCCVAPTHVYEYVDYENLKGYVKTLPPERELADYGVYSLDCEMCYTTHGLDLTRITVINDECKVVYETLIKPLHPIIDYNTRYSGITEEHMADVKTTLLDVQATLLTMFSSKTILIGHSLESDFKALKLIHDTVIDTSVLFPHKMGPPYKRALRNLCSEHLKKIIQNSVDGHDSAEDATVCMELLHYKLKEYLKTR